MQDEHRHCSGCGKMIPTNNVLLCKSCNDMFFACITKPKIQTEKDDKTNDQK